MKSLAQITIQVLQACSTRSGAPTYPQDIRTILRRVEAEGESFLTITLPSFGTAFDRALSKGCLESTDLVGFSFNKKRGLPRFLGGFLSRIFNSNGVLLDEPDTDCIACVRQVTYLHKRILIECTRARVKKAEIRFLECEKELKDHVVDTDVRRYFRLTSRIIWADILRRVPFGDLSDKIKPRHGPGVTSEHLRGNAKFTFDTWNTRLDSEFGFAEFGVGSIFNHLEDGLPRLGVKFLEPRDEIPSRVCFVPKTQKTPRVIAAEPLCMQYMQQGLLGALIPLIEGGRFTGGRVNFRNQSINAHLALSSSADGRYATIDLSEASDRVSASLVRDMLEVAPTLRRQVFACRTSRSVLPSGKVIALRKFASMGSALCFPMEAMAFFIAIVSERIRSAKLSVNPRSVERYSKDLYVYGDDILVPTDEAPAVCDYLNAFAFKVNVDKSFWTGKFRESCGMDAYDGVDVTPVYLRHRPPTVRADARGIVSYTAFVNQLYKAGLWQAVKYLRKPIQFLLGYVPLVPDTIQGVGWHSFSNAMTARRWNKNLHRLEESVLMIVPKWKRDCIHGDAALLKCFGVIGLEAIDPDHLERSVRYGNLALKRRWIAG